jgi:epoxyqueuosine reductase
VELTKEPDYSPEWREAERRPVTPGGLPGTESPSLIELLETALDEPAWDAFVRGSAIRRAGRAGFARNVCVGLGNWGSSEAVPVLTSALADPEPLVRAHAAWALGRVGSAEAKAALSSRTSVESDDSVRSELAAALRP